MSQKHNAVIIAAGEIGNVKYICHESDLVIAADKGYLSAQAIGVVCDRVIGDFDSLGSVPEHDALTVLPVEKDDTDTAYAVKCALEAGAQKIFILGGLGGRLDHTLANIQMLTYIARAGSVGYLVNGTEALTVIKNREVRLHGRMGQTLSVFSLSDKSAGVCEAGLKYTLENAELEAGFPLGVSNEFADTEAVISVADGELLIFSRGDMSSFVENNRAEENGVYQKLNIYF
ncbi:MAG: thiamine diphosphokinase [Clostridia bacterium]|nr:thiamine diphosphokinase [Clostridia bacterium]